MSKWKCEICNSEFDNFQAQGFNHQIYCPLCYFKELYKREKSKIDKAIELLKGSAMFYCEEDRLWLEKLFEELLEILGGK